MSDHQPLPVAGYTMQSPQKVAIVNQSKRLEEQCLRHMDMLRAAADDNGEFDARWLSIARTNLELAFMAMNRAVFKPTRIQGEN
jgi:hypothetical protein